MSSMHFPHEAITGDGEEGVAPPANANRSPETTEAPTLLKMSINVPDLESSRFHLDVIKRPDITTVNESVTRVFRENLTLELILWF